MSHRVSFGAQTGEAFEVLAEGLAPFIDRRVAAHIDEDTDAALQGESATLRKKLREATSAIETANPAETAEGQRWMWLIATAP